MTEPKKLAIHMLMSAADAACRKYDLRPVTTKEAQVLYRRYSAPAILRSNGQIRLWVDPTYIAVQRGAEPVRYMFLTRMYIEEEYTSYRTASHHRKIDLKLPSEIDRQFRAAWHIMDRLDRLIFFTPFAAELELDWINEWMKNCYAQAQKIQMGKLIREYKEAVA